MALTKRSAKGTSLTYAEMDANFTHLGGDGSYAFPATDGTANHVLATDGNGQLSFVAQTSGGGGGIALTDLSIGTEASASGDGSIGYDNTTGVFTYTPPDLSSYLTTVAFSDLTGKPTTISGYGITDAFDGAFASLSSKPTTIAGYGITDAFDGATSSLTGNIDLATQVTGTLPVGNMAATALTTVQTASSESAQLALTAEEGDVVVRTDENKTYMHNGGSAGTMADYTLLATPTDAVTSVDGNTGAVTTLQLGTTSTTALAGDTTFAFSDITSKPTTISGYGITDDIVTSDSSIDAQPVKQLYANQAAFPSASTWHGALAHSHSDGAMFFGHGGSWVQLANDSDIPTAVSSLTNDSNYLTTVAFADLTGKPTTIAGYGITDALQLGTSSTTALAGDTALLQLGTSSTTALAGDTTFAFADITSKPTTIAGYGITDALALGTSSTTALAGDTAIPVDLTVSGAGTVHANNYTDTDTWQANTSSQDGYVASASGQNTKVWKTDSAGNPAWRDDTSLSLGTTAGTAMEGNTTFAFADITSKPTTIAGYGITDALALGTTSTTALAGDTTFAFADITSKPTTISGYGITDAFDGAFASLSSKPTTISGYGITDALALGTTSTTALAGNTTSFGGSASSIDLGTHGGTGTQTINIGGAVIGGASTNIKNIYIGNGANNGGLTNIYIGPSSNTTTAKTTVYHNVDFKYGQVNINADTNPPTGPKLVVSRAGGGTRSGVTPTSGAAIFVDDSNSQIHMGSYWAGASTINFGRGANSSNLGYDVDLGAIAYNNYSNYMYLRAAGAERMRINYSGNVLIGTTSAGSYSSKLRVQGRIETSSGIYATSNGSQFQMGGNYGGATIEARSYSSYSSSAQMIIKLANNSGTEFGSIKIAGAATQFNTSSDQRMKENIQDANDAGAKIDAIRIRQFDWKSEYGGAHQDYGLIAQELQPVAPEAVSEGYSEEDMMSVDYAKLVPTLIKEIQSLRSRVAELENN